jgi:hypothetical protein
MTTTAQAGILGYGLQADGLKGGAVDTWYRHKANVIGLGPVVEKQIPPPEIGGTNNPTGAYVSGTYYAGRISLTPRLEGDFGWLLLALAGACASGANATTGFTHRFTQLAGFPIFIPFMGFRRLIPGQNASVDVGDIGLDCLIQTAVFNFPQVGPMTLDLDVLGRDWLLDEAPDLWTWADQAEAYKSVPMVMKGSGIRWPNTAIFGGNPLPVTNARVTLNNNTTTVQEERIIGSYLPDDFATRQRTLSIEMTYKWANPDLYRFVLNGGDPAVTGFDPCIPNSDFELRIETPCDIDEGSVDHPWAFQVEAPNVSWQASPMQLSGDDILSFDVTGTAVEAASGAAEDYFVLLLENEQASYPLPAA